MFDGKFDPGATGGGPCFIGIIPWLFSDCGGGRPEGPNPIGAGMFGGGRNIKRQEIKKVGMQV